jgi:FAD synthetase
MSKKKVMVFGTFDILHLGHISLFRQARKFGDYLIAVVGRDSTVENLKKTKPIHTENERLSLLREIKLIDQTVLGDKKQFYNVVINLKPDIIALGYDQTFFVDDLKKIIKDKKLPIKIVRMKAFESKKFKSKKIKKQITK